MTRAKALKTLADEIRFFENEGFPVAVWITSLGYGRMTDPDFLRRFPNYRPLVAPNGSTAAVCSTDVAWRDAVAEDVRHFIRAGAKTILFDDDLVQARRRLRMRRASAAVCRPPWRRVRDARRGTRRLHGRAESAAFGLP